MNDVRPPSTPSTDSPTGAPRAKFNFWRWFWLSTIPISLGWLWHDFYAPDNHVTWSKDYASAQQQATRTGKPIIVFFTGKWCSPCRIMKRNVWADSEVESKVNAGFAAVMVDVDDPLASAVVRRYRVGATPNTVITDPKGNVLQQVQGGIDRAHFLEMIASPKL